MSLLTLMIWNVINYKLSYQPSSTAGWEIDNWDSNWVVQSIHPCDTEQKYISPDRWLYIRLYKCTLMSMSVGEASLKCNYKRFIRKPKTFTFRNGYFNSSVINATAKIARVFDKFNLSNQFRFAVILTLLDHNIFLPVCCSGFHYHILCQFRFLIYISLWLCFEKHWPLTVYTRFHQLVISKRSEFVDETFHAQSTRINTA